MKRAIEEFSGDYRVMRVVLASSNPIDTLQAIRSNRYSIRTFLDTLEFLDMKSTIEENEQLRIKRQQVRDQGDRR